MFSKFQTSLLLTLLCCTSVPVSAQGLQPFSSDITFTANGETHRGSVYSDGLSIRIDEEATIDVRKSAIFLGLESGLARQLNFQEKMYIEYPYGTPEDAQFLRYLRDAQVQSEQFGMEFFEGQECNKLRVITTYRGQVYTSIEWRSKALHGLVVKSQDVEGRWSAEYKNIKLGAQPASLFELPSGYNKVAFSRDWISLVKQIQSAGALSDGIAIARKAGLRVEQDGQLSGHQLVSFIDPVTGNSVLEVSENID